MYEKYPYSVDVTYFTSAHREKFLSTHYTRVHQIFWHSLYRSIPTFVMEMD